MRFVLLRGLFASVLVVVLSAPPAANASVRQSFTSGAFTLPDE